MTQRSRMNAHIARQRNQSYLDGFKGAYDFQHGEEARTKRLESIDFDEAFSNSPVSYEDHYGISFERKRKRRR